MELNIEINNQQEKEDVTEELENVIFDAANMTVKEFNIQTQLEVSVTFTDNEGIRIINNEFRNFDRETDVLSFPQLEYEVPGVIAEEYLPKEGEYPSVVFGDIVLSLEKARSQAEEYGHSFLREVGYLTVHSMLHLFGFDHMDDNDKKIMRDKEEKIMNKIGLTR